MRPLWSYFFCDDNNAKLCKRLTIMYLLIAPWIFLLFIYLFINAFICCCCCTLRPWHGSYQRPVTWLLLLIFFFFLEGHSLAKRLSKQISQATKNMRTAVEEFNKLESSPRWPLPRSLDFDQAKKTLKQTSGCAANSWDPYRQSQ